MILYKMLNVGIFDKINGCVSTGKEANVYHAASGSVHLAIKVSTAVHANRAKHTTLCQVFKTSILVFRDRDRYVSGEHRFRHGYCKSNPRKMVKTWAEKEMRNLKRCVLWRARPDILTLSLKT